MKKIAIKLIIAIITVFFLTNSIYGVLISKLDADFQIDDLTLILKEYTNNQYDFDEMGDNLISGKGLDYGLLGNKVINILTKEISKAIKGGLSILIIIILMAVLNSLELEQDSLVNKTAYLVSFLIISAILITSYKDMLQIFNSSVNLMTKIVQAVSPFIMAILMATGCITTTGMIQPLILFIASAMGMVINYIIMPVLTISLVLNILSNISDGIDLSKFASVISKTAVWFAGISFAFMISVLGIDSSLGVSIDSVTVKTAQAVVTSTIPIVGKFVSDSLEVIIGSAEIIGKVSGIMGIIALILVMLTPVIKLFVIIILYMFLAAITESIKADKKTVSLIESFATLYKTMLGILIGIMSIFIISIGIMMSLMGKVTN